MCQHSNRCASSRPSSMRNTQVQGVRHPTTSPQTVAAPHRRAGRPSTSSPPLTNNENAFSGPMVTPNNSLKGRKPAHHTGQNNDQSRPKQARSEFVNNNFAAGRRSGTSSPKQAWADSHRSYGPQRSSPINIQGAATRQVAMSPTKQSRFDGAGSPSKSPVPNLAYAGAKFSDPPSPKVLPKPPTHWVSCGFPEPKVGNYTEMTNVLKVMLKVQS